MADDSSSQTGPAEELVGLTLEGGVQVIERINRHPGGTGHSRSSCYRGLDGANPVFIKAFDFRYKEIHGNTKDLEWMLREFNNEAKVLSYCGERQFARTARLLSQGKVQVQGETVHYLVCECAQGSVRDLKMLDDKTFSLVERIEIVRDVASAIQELHRHDVAHQDIKPSNVVIFQNLRLKVTDMGSASCLNLEAAPHDSLPCVGEISYAPYERLYDAEGSWYQKKMGCDLFLVGNLAFTLVMQAPCVPFVIAALPEELKPFNHGGSYRDVLPDIQREHQMIIQEFLSAKLPAPLSARFIRAVQEMTNPDPTRRGHPKNLLSSSAQYSLERYISCFNMLAYDAKRLQLELS